MKKVKNLNSFIPISGVLFLRLTCNKTLTQMFASLHKNTIITLLLIHKLTNYSFQYTCPAIYILSVLFSQEKVSFSAKVLQFNVNYLQTCVYILVCLLFSCSSEYKETKSNRCNQIGFLLQRDFRLRKYYTQS